MKKLVALILICLLSVIGVTVALAENINYPISNNAQGLIITGSDRIIASDWALIEGNYNVEMVLALTNISEESIPNVEVQIVFYAEDGSIIASERDGHDVFLPGSTVVSKKNIYNMEVLKASSIEITLDTERFTNSYVNHAESLSIQSNPSGDYVYLQVTNNDPDTIAEIEIVVVFYKDGNIVGAAEDEVTNLASGSKHILEFYGYESTSADSYQYFINQAHTW